MSRVPIALVALVVLSLFVTGCGPSGAASGPTGSSGPAVSSRPAAAASAGPTSAASQAPEEEAAALVPAIDPSRAVRPEASRGAFAVIVLGAFGQVQAKGQAECFWDRELSPPTFRRLETAPITLMGEQVVIDVDHGPILNRGAAARYIPTGGLSWDPTPVGDAVVARSTDLEVDTGAALPEGADPSAYGAPLSGRADTASLDVTVAWRCEPGTSGPNASVPAASAEEPTPVCPPKVQATPPVPVGPLVLRGSSEQAAGVAFSSSWVTCDDSGAADGDWAVPDSPLAVGRGTPMILSLDGPGVLFDVAAFYAPAGAATTPTNMLTLTVRPGPTPNTFAIDPPPAGDWALVVSSGIADADHGQVTNATFIYRVKVVR